MARSKAQRKVTKDQLALAVRKNFNAAAVNEIDVMVDLLYKIRNQGARISNPGFLPQASTFLLQYRQSVPNSIGSIKEQIMHMATTYVSTFSR